MFRILKKSIALALMTVLVFPFVSAVHADDPCSNLENGGQRATYCTAAKDAEQASTAAKVGMGIWGAVAAVCAYSCAMSYAGGTAESACTWSNIGGSVADLAVTLSMSKDMQSSLTGLTGLLGTGMTAYMTYNSGSTALAAEKQVMATNTLTSRPNNPIADPSSTQINKEISGNPQNYTDSKASTALSTDKANRKRSSSSCYAAAMAGVQVLMKGITMSQSDQTAQQNLNEASQLAAGNPAQVATLNAQSSGTAVATSPVRSNAVGSGESTSSAGSSACGNAMSSGNAGAVVSCATAENPSLAPLVTSPQFASNFQNATGMPLGDYFKGVSNAGSGAQAAGQAFGALPNAAAVQAQLDSMEKQVAAKMGASDAVTGSAYARGGAGSSSGKAEESPADEMTKMMAEMMSKLMPDDEHAKNAAAIQQVAFMTKGRDAGQIMEMRNVSLFDRVGYRYRLTSNRLDMEPWSAGTNQVLNSNRGANAQQRTPASTY